MGLILAAAALVLGAGSAAAATPSTARPDAGTAPAITHGVVVGDVTASSAVLWARADRDARLNVALSGGRHRRIPPAHARAADDNTARAPLRGLSPATTYTYRAWFSVGPGGSSPGPEVQGSFRTAPPPRATAPLRLAFGGDLAGQNVCRDAAEGFPILGTVEARRPDIFVGLGDMIYADNPCDAVGRYGNAQVPGGFGPATDLATFRAHWRYGRSDPALQRLLERTDYVGVWDDHEVINDFGPLTDMGSAPPYTPGVHLMPLGLRAFVEYTPIAGARGSAPRLYRALRWGKNAELFVLDTRHYRDANFAEDTGARPKTMLGHKQLAWLKRRLARSNARWKVIVSSVPMSIPTGFPPENGRDGWANFDQNTGYERELLDILRFMQSHGIRNSVWITTDVHFAEAFRYRPFADHPDFTVTELVTGPMNSGIFPNRDFDTTLNPERLAFFGPSSADAVTSWTEAKSWFNFGELDFSRAGSLTLRILNTAGETAFERTIPPAD